MFPLPSSPIPRPRVVHAAAPAAAVSPALRPLRLRTFAPAANRRRRAAGRS